LRNFRYCLAFLGSVIVIVTALGVIAVWVLNWKLGLPANADKVSRINTVVAVSAYVAAVLAAVFALIAYWQASGLPSLKADAVVSNYGARGYTLDPIAKNRPVPDWVKINASPFESLRDPVAVTQGEDGQPVLPQLGTDGIQLQCEVTITNTTKYSARNPGIRIGFYGLLYKGDVGDGWKVVETWGPDNGLRTIQWDGGTDNIAHGNWTRKLPRLNFYEVVVIDQNPTLDISLVADGIGPQKFRSPVKWHW
jgi:hypothetical protein